MIARGLHYGEEKTEGHGPFDRGRDDLFLPMIRAMAEAGKPGFGICRVVQEMRVAAMRLPPHSARVVGVQHCRV